MRCTVVWDKSALDKLAQYWVAAPDQRAFTDAADQIDRVLMLQPERGQGTGAVRRLRIDPLEVLYTYSADDCMVSVVDVDLVS